LLLISQGFSGHFICYSKIKSHYSLDHNIPGFTLAEDVHDMPSLLLRKEMTKPILQGLLIHLNKTSGYSSSIYTSNKNEKEKLYKL